MRRLIYLYLINTINKITILITLLSIIIIFAVLYLMFQIPIDYADYLLNGAAYLEEYKNNSLFFISLINLVLVSSLVGFDATNNVTRFDVLFSSEKRSKVYFAKIISHLIIISTIILFEFFIYELLPSIYYSKYIVSINNYRYLLANIIYALFIISLGELICQKIKHFFSAFILFVVIFAAKMIADISTKLRDSINIIFPNIYNLDKGYFVYGEFVVIINIVIILFVGSYMYNDMDYGI